MSYSEYNFNNELAECSHSYLTLPLFKLLNKNTNKKILDVGCGNGYLVRLLIEKGYDAYGIDASVSGINIAKKFYSDRFFLHNIENQDLPYSLNKMKFDTVISTEVIEHIFSPVKFVEWIKSLLRSSQGQVIISTPYHGYLKNVIIAGLNKWDDHHTVLWEGGHIKFWSRKTLTKLLTEHGFVNIKFYGCGRIPLLWKSMIITGEIK